MSGISAVFFTNNSMVDILYLLILEKGSDVRKYVKKYSRKRGLLASGTDLVPERFGFKNGFKNMYFNPEHTHTHTHTHTYENIDKDMQKYILARTHVHTHIRKHIERHA